MAFTEGLKTRSLSMKQGWFIRACFGREEGTGNAGEEGCAGYKGGDGYAAGEEYETGEGYEGRDGYGVRGCEYALYVFIHLLSAKN